MNHLISTAQFTSLGEVLNLFHLAEMYREHHTDPPLNEACKRLNPKEANFLENRVVGLIFHERSTRTRCSFEAATYRAGGRCIVEGMDTSSAGKGESLDDTVRTMTQYSDLLVVRTDKSGALGPASTKAACPIINGGDGNNEHPTQALLDLYTVWRKKPDLDFSVMFCGDLADGRPVHSWINLIKNLNLPVKVYLNPADGMDLTQQWKAKLGPHTMVAHKDTGKFLPSTDVLYMTRVQAERKNTTKPAQGFTLRPDYMTLLHGNALVMHPLPRNGEIPTDIDADPRAMYHTEQVQNGLHLRTALMRQMLDGKLFQTS